MLANILQIEDASIASRGHYCRMFQERQCSVGHNRCKGILDPVERQLALQCTLCRQDDTYEHWIRLCPQASMVETRCVHQQRYREWAATLETDAEKEIAGLIL